MRKMLRKSNKGFTLIELMIVVAIIGILAAIAIPNFLRFQLKAKSSEGKVNVAAIRTAETAYNAEFGQYVPAAVSPTAAPPVGAKQPWAVIVAGAGFDILGWAPEGNVYFNYGVVTGVNSFTVGAMANIDGIAPAQAWGYVHGPNPVAANGCVATGVWDASLATPAMTLFDTVGPCTATSGQSDF
jgi:type IV pilus assembly protein PilA